VLTEYLRQATGSLGSHILKALVQAGRFNVTVLARAPLKENPSGAQVKVVDFESTLALTAALEGQDALVDATSVPDPTFALRLMDAAVAARVYRIIPAEFSGDPKNSKARSLPPFAGKAKAFEYLQKLASTSSLTWTLISNNAFLDWGLRTAFLGIDLQKKSIEYLNDGNMTIPYTTLSSVGIAVANALGQPEETKNRICYICNAQMTQRELANRARQALGEDGWQAEDLDMGAELQKAMDELQAGRVTFEVIRDIIRFSISTPGYVQKFEQTDNELLGVRAMDYKEIEDLIRGIA